MEKHNKLNTNDDDDVDDNVDDDDDGTMRIYLPELYLET